MWLQKVVWSCPLRLNAPHFLGSCLEDLQVHKHPALESGCVICDRQMRLAINKWSVSPKLESSGWDSEVYIYVKKERYLLNLADLSICGERLAISSPLAGWSKVTTQGTIYKRWKHYAGQVIWSEAMEFRHGQARKSQLLTWTMEITRTQTIDATLFQSLHKRLGCSENIFHVHWYWSLIMNMIIIDDHISSWSYMIISSTNIHHGRWWNSAGLNINLRLLRSQSTYWGSIRCKYQSLRPATENRSQLAMCVG